MKNFKRIVSLILVTTMILSTLTISIVSVSAASEVNYSIESHTGGGNCKSADIMKIKINGENGSTGWHSFAAMCAIPGKTTKSFKDIDVGKITSISVKNIGIDGWYPSYFVINSPLGNTTIYGGKWVDDSNTVTFSTTDNVVYFSLCTASDFGSGTDADVYMQFIDENGCETPKYNLTDLHYQINPFEMGDVLRRYISLPSDFGKITKAKLSIDRPLNVIGTDWQVEFLFLEMESGKHQGKSSLKNLNEWCTLKKPITINYTW